MTVLKEGMEAGIALLLLAPALLAVVVYMRRKLGL
jgi:hypothetical protein